MSDLVTNGSFTGNATGWTLQSGWAYDTNNISCDGTQSSASAAFQAIDVVIGGVYSITFTVSNHSAGYVFAFVGNDFGTGRAANGTFTEQVTYRTGSLIGTVLADTNFVGTIDNVSAIEISRPVGQTRRRRVRYYKDEYEYKLGDPFLDDKDEDDDG